jgi:hypothetical protein
VIGARAVVVLTASAVLVAIVPRVARACSLPSGTDRVAVVPLDGAVDVPTNAEIRVYYNFGEYAATGDLERPVDPIVRVVGGASIGVTSMWRLNPGWIEVIVLTPTDPLMPGTAYEILDTVHGSMLTSEHRVVATFTTGDGPDVTPPVFAGALPAGPSDLDVCDDTACCGPYVISRSALRWDAATDDHSWLAYEVEPFSRLIYGNGAEWVCSGSHMFGGRALGAGPHRVRAIDLAGNTDDNDVWVTLTFSCEPPVMGIDAGATSVDGGASVDGAAAPVDGGAASMPDAGRDGMVSDAGLTPAGGCDGCTISRPTSRGAFYGGLIVIGTVVVRRRRRRRLADAPRTSRD